MEFLKIQLKRILFLLFLKLCFLQAEGAEIYNSYSEDKFGNYVYIYDDCFSFTPDDNFNEELQKSDTPKLVIRCPFGPFQTTSQKTVDGPKQITRFGPTRYTHIFYKVTSVNIIEYWKEIYGQLSITKSKENFFEFSVKFYWKYPHYSVKILKESYWRSQWNQDKFRIRESHELIYNSLQDYEQLPTQLQKETNRPPDIHNFYALLYSSLSGWGGSRCKFYTLHEKLYELTITFNAFDMIFCEIFNYYNLTFRVNYNFPDFVYMRPFLLRDDLTSAFPPDPNSVFYESPGITFIILKEAPIQWDNIARPFSFPLWGLILSSSLFLFMLSKLFSPKARAHLIRKEFKYIFTTSSELSYKNGQPSEALRLCNLFVKIFRFILTSAYSGMILAGFLDPTYPWSPKTFKELNQSTNYYAATSFDSSVKSSYLKSSHMLNGIKKWRDDNINGRIINNPGEYLSVDELDKKNRYALMMYDDKKYLYIYARSQLWMTSKYVHRLETDKEVVLREMRYISCSSGATKLHFLIQAIRRCFETGSWLRWKYLEENYYKYVAPRIVQKYGVLRPPLLRSLNTLDILTLVYVWAGGLSVSFICLCVEVNKGIFKGFYVLFRWIIQAISYIMLGLINILLAISYRLQRFRSWLMKLNQLK